MAAIQTEDHAVLKEKGDDYAVLEEKGVDHTALAKWGPHGGDTADGAGN